MINVCAFGYIQGEWDAKQRYRDTTSYCTSYGACTRHLPPPESNDHWSKQGKWNGVRDVVHRKNVGACDVNSKSEPKRAEKRKTQEEHPNAKEVLPLD